VLEGRPSVEDRGKSTLQHEQAGYTNVEAGVEKIGQYFGTAILVGSIWCSRDPELRGSEYILNQMLGLALDFERNKMNHNTLQCTEWGFFL
jgi:hypothetical protein